MLKIFMTMMMMMMMMWFGCMGMISYSTLIENNVSY